MIYKKQYGQPFDTESVVGSFLPMMETIPYLTKEPDGFSYAMEPQDVLYGLGENVRGINKRGWVYESKCSDDGNHTEGKSSLYGAYNFMIVSGKDTFGFFIDYPGKVTFDCGYTDMDTLRITVAEENYDLYIIEGESLLLNVKRLLTSCPTACDHHQKLIRNLVSVLANKILLFNEKITHISKRTTREKLLSYLSAESIRQSSLSFDIPFDRQQLADFLCVERAAMSVELSKLQKEGLLVTKRNHFELLTR